MTRHLSVLGLFVCAGAASAQLSSHGFATGGAAIPGDINEYTLDDGTGENAIGLTAGGNVAYLNRFNVSGGNSVVTNIRIAFGTPLALNGAAIFVGVWADAGGGTPGAFLSGMNGVVANASAAAPLSNVFNSFDITDVNVGANGTSFLVGFFINGHLAGHFPGGIDQTLPHGGRSFIGFGAAALNQNTLGAGLTTYGEIGSFGATLAGDWMIRADAIPAPGAAAVLGLAGLVGLRRRR